MARKKPSRRGAARSKVAKRRTYHHGALAEALIESAIEMLEEGGEKAVNMREAARRAGVSSGAPFRHFDSKQALLAAVAEEVAARLDAAMRRAAARADADDSLDRFRAMGIEFVVWAVEHPALFSLLFSREHQGFDRSHRLWTLEHSQRELIDGLISDVDAQESSELVLLASQSLVYGLARILIDGVWASERISAKHARALAAAVTGVLGRGLGVEPESPQPG